MAPKQEDILIHRFLFPGDHPDKTINYNKGSKLTLAIKKIEDIRQEVHGTYMLECYKVKVNTYGSFHTVSISSVLHNTDTLEKRYDYYTFGNGDSFLTIKKAIVHFLRWYLLCNDGIIDLRK